jgi:hypothetical protein
MRKLIALCLMLCIVTAITVGTAAAKPTAKLTQKQQVVGTGVLVGAYQYQINSAYLGSLGAGVTISQGTYAGAFLGGISSTQVTKIKIAA